MQKNSLSYYDLPPLSIPWRWIYAAIAFFLVAFGQPSWVPGFGLIAACIGYALFWRTLLCISLPSQRFWWSFVWLFCVQLIQISWFISHPYLYIYAVYLFIAALFGAQFGIIGLFINSKMISSLWRILTLASLWAVFEWSRLFILSGFSFNPVGVVFGGSLYALQMASLGGVFALSFWVFLTNLLALRAWVFTRHISNLTLWLLVALTPYAFGLIQILNHEKTIESQKLAIKPSSFNALLVQTAFPVEESLDFNMKHNMIGFVTEEWQKILTIIEKYQGKPIDLMVLPEFVVPFGTYANIYAFDEVVSVFHQVLGSESLTALPSPEWPLGGIVTEEGKENLMVNNAYWVQSIANVFKTGVIVGLEDAEDKPNKEREYYSAAILFQTHLPRHESVNSTPSNIYLTPNHPYYAERYEKRVLVPLGEYIPFSFCRELAKQYGVFGSFTPGTEAKVMQCGKLKISPSICYEETFGDLIREGREKGAEVLVNLTSDVWYPNSRLPSQHLEHARFRTVENGVPLIRACNTGVTAAIDSLGRSVAVLGGESPEKVEWIADALYVQVPTYSYTTLYSQFGDKLIIGFSLLIILISACFKKFSF
ncbi:MAG: apolipoprotein N-acyltransferase [Parachlamydiaceae bacterium]|nr:apolipoprotein N-acyltransferase [Parachlamydiaceae bacterium]